MEKPGKKRLLKIIGIILAVIILASCGTAAFFYSQIAGVFDEGDAGTLNQETEDAEELNIESGGDRSITCCCWALITMPMMTDVTMPTAKA